MEVDPLCFGVVWQWKEEWIPTNIKKIKRLMFRHWSVQTLKLKRGWVFQQDDDPQHSSKSTMKYLQEIRMRVVECPLQSHTNIIANLWRDLKHAIHARRLKNISELEIFCQKE